MAQRWFSVLALCIFTKTKNVIEYIIRECCKNKIEIATARHAKQDGPREDILGILILYCLFPVIARSEATWQSDIVYY